jgi:hypothetical protein
MRQSVAYKNIFHNQCFPDASETLACQSCPRQFGTPWSLLKHAQNVHALKIYLERGSSSRGVAASALRRDRENKATDSVRHAVVCSKEDDCKSELAVEMQRVSDHVSFASPITVQIYDAAEADVKHLDAVSSDADSCTAVDAARSDFSAEPTAFRDAKLVIDMENVDPSQQLADADDSGRSAAVLDKCCTAVVPKKRKRHMEMKHGGSGGSSIRKRSHSIQGTPTSIYIDLEPGAEGEVFKASLSHGDDERSKTSGWISDGIRRHSVIIPPGTTFSIPVSYASSTTMSAASKSFMYVQAGPQQEPTSSCGVARNDAKENRASPAAGVHDSNGQRNGGATVLQKQSATAAAPAISADCESLNDGRGDEQENDGSQGHQQKRRRYPTSRPFKCDQCNDSFNQRVHLKKHQSKHTGQLPATVLLMADNLILLYTTLLG